mgnify:CR=1 FL=1
MNPPEPQKTAVDQMDSSHPLARQMHFLISRVIKPALPTYPIELVELEAVFSKSVRVNVLVAKKDYVEAEKQARSLIESAAPNDFAALVKKLGDTEHHSHKPRPHVAGGDPAALTDC